VSRTSKPTTQRYSRNRRNRYFYEMGYHKHKACEAGYAQQPILTAAMSALSASGELNNGDWVHWAAYLRAQQQHWTTALLPLCLLSKERALYCGCSAPLHSTCRCCCCLGLHILLAANIPQCAAKIGT
jgi:hypothetical protein